MSKDYISFFLEILNHIKTDTTKVVVLIAKQRLIVYPVIGVVTVAIAVPLFYWIYMSKQYKLSEKDAVSVCDMEFKRAVILSETTFQIPNITIIDSKVTDFQGVVSEGFYYVYLTYNVEQKEDTATTDLTTDMDALSEGNVTTETETETEGNVTTETETETEGNPTYSRKQVFCKVNKISLQPSKKIARANLEQMVIHNQN